MDRPEDVRRMDVEVDNYILDRTGVLLDMARARYLGREGQLTGPLLGDHVLGRHGVVSGVMLGGQGRLLLLFYVYRMGTREILNTHGWTRQYRTLDDLTLENRGGEVPAGT